MLIQRGHRSLLNHFACAVLCIGGHAEHERAGIFLVLTHEQILHLCAASHRQQKQTCGDRVEGAAMADFLGSKFSSRQRHYVVRRHSLGFIDEQDAIRRARRA